jgi:hypothetical protein
MSKIGLLAIMGAAALFNKDDKIYSSKSGYCSNVMDYNSIRQARLKSRRKKSMKRRDK